MSLNYDLRNVALNKHTRGIQDGKPVKWGPMTEAIIFATMAVDMGQITAENSKKFYTRHKMWQRVNGLGNVPGLNYEVITAHAGLKTNVTTLSDAAFNKTLITRLDTDAALQVREEMGDSSGIYPAGDDLPSVDTTNPSSAGEVGF